MGSGGDGSDGMGGGSDGGGGGVAAGPRALYNLVSRGGASPAASNRAVGVASVSAPPHPGALLPAALRAFRPPCRRGRGHGGRLDRLRTVCMKALGSLRRATHSARGVSVQCVRGVCLSPRAARHRQPQAGPGRGHSHTGPCMYLVRPTGSCSTSY